MSRSPNALRTASIATVAVLLTTACEPRVTLLEPEGAAAGDATTLTVTVSDPALAERLGLSPGAGVPGATVSVRRDETREVLTFLTDEAGILELGDLPSGLYWIWAEHHPVAHASGESGQPPPALGGGVRTRLRRGKAVSIELRGHEPGSLVISEFYYHHPRGEILNLNTAYHYQMYLELRNDSDTTIYLDGKIVGGAFNYRVDSPAWPCTETAAWRNEPRGLFAQSFQAFPGGGAEYPVAPGEVVLIAEQAIDHSAIYPGLPDMSHADFQFYWEDRALNPDVPTMLPIQLRTSPLGTVFSRLAAAPFVANALDVNSLERISNLQGDFALFPKEHILDLAELINEYYLVPRRSPLCGNFVHLSFDALTGFVGPSSSLHPDAHLLASQRKLLPDGSGLQRTGTSAVDWEIGPRSPGWVP